MVEYRQGPLKRPTAAERLDFAERDLRDHAKTLTALAESLKAMNDRLALVEKSIHDWRVADARAEERAKALHQWMMHVDKELAGIKGVGIRLLWIVGGSVITTAVAFILRGELLP